MPLPGGPSGKLGNRYELRWIVRRLVDLVTGRLEWIRIEPPGEHAIEFRCQTGSGEEAHQIKRGLSGGGHWTIAALGDVLDGFGTLLATEPGLLCAFGSEHAAPELQELSERARHARDSAEFIARFLDAKTIAKAWTQLQARWGTDERETWQRLRRITVTSVSEQHLQADIDQGPVRGPILPAFVEQLRLPELRPPQIVMSVDEGADPLVLFERKQDVNVEPVEQVLGEFRRVDRYQWVEPATRERVGEPQRATKLIPTPAFQAPSNANRTVLDA